MHGKLQPTVNLTHMKNFSRQHLLTGCWSKKNMQDMKISFLPVVISSFTVCFYSLFLKTLKHLKEIIVLFWCFFFISITSKSIFLFYLAKVLSPSPKRNLKKIQPEVFAHLENLMSNVTRYKKKIWEKKSPAYKYKCICIFMWHSRHKERGLVQDNVLSTR